MKRRGKMLARVIAWTGGVLLGFYAREWMGGHPDPTFFFAFWSGMMLVALFVHLDPPAIETWDQPA